MRIFTRLFRKTRILLVFAMFLLFMALRFVLYELDITLDALAFTILKEIQVNPPGDQLFIVSTHYIPNINTYYSKHIIRMNVFGKNGLTNENIFCEIDDQQVRARLKRVSSKSDLCAWVNYFLDCPVSSRPNSVMLSDGGNKRHDLKLAVPDTTPRTLVICFSRLFFFENWQMLLASLELYDYFGADLMVVQILSVIDKLYPILKAYEEAGKLRVMAAPKIPKFHNANRDPNSQVEWLNLIASYLNCQHEYRESAQFILNVDIDEILVPHKFGNLKEELLHLSSRYPNAGSFEFLRSSVRARMAPNPKTFSVSKLMEYNYSNKIANYGKSVIVPKRVDLSHVHSPLPENLHNGYMHVKLTKNDALILHFRDLFSDKLKFPKDDKYFVNSTAYQTLDLRLRSFLNKELSTRQSFLSLPRYPQNSVLFNECYKRFVEDYENNRLNICPNPLECHFNLSNMDQLSSCIVLQNEYVFTKFESGLHISSVVGSEFRQAENCFIE